MVEIDAGVVEFSKEYLPSLSDGAFEDPRLDLVIADGAEFVANTDRRFDVAIVDSTDPVGPGEVLFTDTFYGRTQRCLNDGGILVTQNGVPFMQGSELSGGPWPLAGEPMAGRGRRPSRRCAPAMARAASALATTRPRCTPPPSPCPGTFGPWSTPSAPESGAHPGTNGEAGAMRAPRPRLGDALSQPVISGAERRRYATEPRTARPASCRVSATGSGTVAVNVLASGAKSEIWVLSNGLTPPGA
jgi:Spermine/spermidine synthase domain